MGNNLIGVTEITILSKQLAILSFIEYQFAGERSYIT